MLLKRELPLAWETTKPIVVPVDFSGMSVDAVGAACELAASSEQVHVVHVVVTLDQIAPVTDGLSLPTDEDRRAAVCQHFAQFLKTHGFASLKEVVLDGRPGPTIADYATQIGAGLIVIPSHGYDGVKRLLLGSVTEQVIRLAECPVFVLRRQDAE